MGWLTPTPITSNTYNLKIVDLETNPVAYRVWRNGVINDTFFILENRQSSGFDAPLPGQGLLIWHIDPRYNDFHNVVDLEEADGCDILDNGWGYRPDPHYYYHELGDSGDPFLGDSNTMVFDSLSYPASTDNSGNNTNVTVKNIALITDTIICDIIIDPTGINESENTTAKPRLSIQPNPFRKRTNITCGTGQRGKGIELRIYNATGRLVKSFSLSTAYSLLPTVFSWDGRDDYGTLLPAGIYWCMTDQEHKLHEKIIFLQ